MNWIKQIPRVVTPCAGVWIEITEGKAANGNRIVTPCAGVWIEIDSGARGSDARTSLPVRECGLKCP